MNSFLLILFLIYSLVIVFIENFNIIITLLLIELFIVLFLEIKFNLKNIVYFLIFIFFFNLLLTNLSNASIILLRLFTMYLIVLIVINKIGINNIALTFSKLFHSKELYLIISISLSFIPILKDEILNIRKTLLIKNYPCTLINVIKNPKIFVVTFFSNLFNRVSELEKIIITSGFYD